MTTTIPKGFREGFDGSLACKHRDLSVCETCFNATPGLIDVYSAVFVYEPDEWDPSQLADAQVRVSPGT